MRFSVWMVWFASLGLAAVVCTIGSAGNLGSCLATCAETAEKSAGPPPLVVDKSAPLLLDEPPELDPFDVPQGPVVDNSACFVCHANYEEELFAVEHAKVNCGCMKCHGPSLAHRDDEDNITPPDVMFPPEAIEANCKKCHDGHDAPAVMVIARWQECCPEKTDPKTLLCMDCHGKHRLKLRTVRWNKKTGELIVQKKCEPAEKAAEGGSKSE